MSFYNPNIQAAFDGDKHEFIVLRNVVLATYDMVFRIQDGCTVSNVDDLRATYQLEFVQFDNPIQQRNLEFIKVDFPNSLAEIALCALIGKVKTFEDFLHYKLKYTPEVDRNQVLYLGDSIQDFIELLVYSDIAGDKPSKGERDYTKLLGLRNTDSAIPVFYNLYDRLKLFARLRKELKLEIDNVQIDFTVREVRFELCLSV